MSTATEVAKLVVKLTGDNTQYKKTLQKSTEDTNKFTRDVRGRLHNVRGEFVKEYRRIDTSLKLTQEKMNRGVDIMRKVETATEKYGFEIKELNNLLKVGAINQTTFNRAVKMANAELNANTIGRMSQQLKGFGTAMSIGVTLPVVGFGIAATKSFADFNSAMTESTAIMKATEEQQKRMADLAKELGTGGTVNKGPRDLAEAYFFLASAGKDAEQSMALLPQVAKFATAGAFDMASATDLLTDAQSSLGLSFKDPLKDMESMARLSDVLVAANTLSNAKVKEFSEALTNDAAATMKAFNIQLEEGVAVLAAYADQGTKGQEAGSSFGRMIRLLTAAYRENRAEFEKLNVEVYKNGEVDLTGAIDELSLALADLTPEAKGAQLELLGFEALSQKAILPLLGTADKIREYNKNLKIMGGITDDVANKQMKSFSNEMKVIWERIKLAASGIGEILAPAVKFAGEVMASTGEVFGMFHPVVQKIIVGIVALTALIGPLAVALGTLAGVFAAVTASATASAAAIAGLKIAIIGLKGVAVVVIGAMIANWIEGEVVMKKFNDQLERQVKLNEQLKSVTQKRQERVFQEATGLSGQERKDFLENHLKQASDQTDTYKERLTAANEKLKEMYTVSRRVFNPAAVIEQREAVNELLEQYKQSKDFKLQLEAEINSLSLSPDLADGGGITSEMQNRAKELVESLLTPQEKQRKAVSELADLHAEGAISLETYNRALENLKTLIPNEEMEEWNRKTQRATQIIEGLKSPADKLLDQINELKDLKNLNLLDEDQYQSALKNLQDELEKMTRKEYEIRLTTVESTGTTRDASTLRRFAEFRADAISQIRSSTDPKKTEEEKQTEKLEAMRELLERLVDDGVSFKDVEGVGL